MVKLTIGVWNFNLVYYSRLIKYYFPSAAAVIKAFLKSVTQRR